MFVLRRKSLAIIMKMNVFLRKLLLYVPVKMVPAISGIFLIFYLYKLFPEGQYVLSLIHI